MDYIVITMVVILRLVLDILSPTFPDISTCFYLHLYYYTLYLQSSISIYNIRLYFIFQLLDIFRWQEYMCFIHIIQNYVKYNTTYRY